MENSDEPRTIEIGQESLTYLNKTRKWTMFFAILGFIFIGMLIIAGILASTFLSFFELEETGTEFPQWTIIVVCLLLSSIYFFPILFLFRFSKHTANAVATLNSEEIRLAFKNLKSCFAYLGVLLIIVLSLYVIALIIAGTSMAFLKAL
jgi:hypothetical protein